MDFTRRFSSLCLYVNDTHRRRIGLSFPAASPLPQALPPSPLATSPAAARAHPTASWQRRLVKCGCTYTASTARNGRASMRMAKPTPRRSVSAFPRTCQSVSVENKAKSVPAMVNGTRWRNSGRESHIPTGHPRPWSLPSHWHNSL
jgi:hypothetical protein